MTRQDTTPTSALLLACAVMLAPACGSSDGGDPDDITEPEPETPAGSPDGGVSEEQPPGDPGGGDPGGGDPGGGDPGGGDPGGGLDYPTITAYFPSIAGRGLCDAKDNGVEVCCADYAFEFRLSNTTADELTRITKLAVQIPGVVTDTGNINCDQAPWILGPGQESAEDIAVVFRYEGATGAPSITYPCGDAEVEVDVNPLSLPDGDAPGLGSAVLTIDGRLPAASWSSYAGAELLDLAGGGCSP